jgi:hypothetical protein
MDSGEDGGSILPEGMPDPQRHPNRAPLCALTHSGEPLRPPPITPARWPPDWDDRLDPLSDWDALAQPEPEFAFDQRISW